MRIASTLILTAIWLVVTAVAMPQVVDREDPPPTPPSPPKPIATADEVDITRPNGTTTPDNKPPIPITVQLFSSSPGVKTCRSGSKIVDMELPKNASTNPQFTSAQGQCFNLAGTAQCGLFMGNKADGCEAKLFRGERCTAFVNVAVFQNELRPVGGFFTSMSIRCGIVPVEPKPLSLGGLGAKMQRPGDKGKQGTQARAIDAAMRAGSLP